MEDLLRFNFQQKYLLFDAETEGLNLRYSRPWQLSWVETVGKKIVGKQDYLLRWDDLRVSEGAAKVTGFDRKEYIKNAVDPYFVFELLWKKMNDPSYLISGHNILNFDVYIINVLRQYLGFDVDYSFITRCLDTRALFLAILKGVQKPEDESLIEWQYKLLNSPQKGLRSTLMAMLKHFDIKFDETKLHDSLYDIEMNTEALFKILNQLDL